MLAIAAIHAGAAAEPFKKTMLRYAVHADAEPHWADSLWRDAARDCDLASSAQCVANYVMIRNDHAAAIVCKVSMDLPSAPGDDGGPARHVEATQVVKPAQHIPGLVVMGRAEDVPSNYSTVCEVARTQGNRAVDYAACAFKITKSPSVAESYPQESRARREEGDVSLEFSIDPDSGKLVDPKVATSSGFRSLDDATLAMAQRMRGKSLCSRMRYFVTIRWRVDVSGDAYIPGTIEP